MISKEEYYTVCGLYHLAAEANKKIDDCVNALGSILGKGDQNTKGWVYESIFGEYGVDGMLDRMGIEVGEVLNK